MTIDTKTLRMAAQAHRDCEQETTARLIDDAANLIESQVAEIARLREALENAQMSLGAIGAMSGYDEYLTKIDQIRGYARSRSGVARAVLSQGDQG